MFWKSAHACGRGRRSSRALEVELLESRMVPSGMPGAADFAAAGAELIVSATVCVAASDPAATPDATGLSARVQPPIVDSGVGAATPAPVLENVSEVISQPQASRGDAHENRATHPLPENPADGSNARIVGSQTGDKAMMNPAGERSPSILRSNLIAMDGYGGGGDVPPTTSGIPDVYVDEDAADMVIQLYDAFDDPEDGSDGLAYSVTGNTNSSLLDSVGIEGYGGLVLEFAPDAFGEATLTIRATDTANQSVETSFTVHVASVDDPPVISDFAAILELGDLWTLTGTVTDVDDPVAGMVVSFGGVFANFGVTATVQADGTFSLTGEFLGLQSGTATAQTQDPHGLYSDETCYEITV